jgi:hypothetical protein
MQDHITPDNVSKEQLLEILEAAMMDVELDSDGDIKVKDAVNCFIFVSQNKTTIQLFSQFGWSPDASKQQCYEYVNELNRKYFLVKATVRDNNGLGFEYDVSLRGGVSPRNFVQTVKRFCSIPREAISAVGTSLVA